MHFKSLVFQGSQPGPRLIVTGAVHGNEVCGTRAIERTIDDLDAGHLKLLRGRLTLVPVTNPKAYQRGERNGDRNLNRNLAPTAVPQDFEDHVANWLCPLLAANDVLLDLHSTRASNPAFAMLGPVNNRDSLQPFCHFEAERALAHHLGVNRFVEGWLDTYALGVARRKAAPPVPGSNNHLTSDAKYGVGTTEYMRSVGGFAITLECGQHADPNSPEVGYRAIHNALAHLGMVDAAPPAPPHKPEHLRLFDVIDRLHHDDQFEKPWASFMPVRGGEHVATRASGEPVVSPCEGYVVFPDANAAPGHEWFYLARAI